MYLGIYYQINIPENTSVILPSVNLHPGRYRIVCKFIVYLYQKRVSLRKIKIVAAEIDLKIIWRRVVLDKNVVNLDVAFVINAVEEEFIASFGGSFAADEEIRSEKYVFPRFVTVERRRNINIAPFIFSFNTSISL